MDAYAHRMAIGRRFGSRIAAGDAVFLAGTAGILGLPCTVTDGDSRQLGGVNRFMLMQVMKDRSWSDPRFFTVAQVAQAGWKLAPDAKKICLQFLTSTGIDGLPLEVPESKRFHVFNASEIVGVPDLGIAAPAKERLGDMEVAAASAGFTVGVRGARAVVQDWLSSLHTARAEAAPLDTALRVELASSLLEVQAGLPGAGGINTEFAAEWVQRIETDPLSFFQAVRDAETLTAMVMVQVRAARIERQAVEDLACVRELMDEPNVQKTGVGMVRKAGATARVEAMWAEREAVLAVRWADKDRVNKLGAVWYAPQSLWFVPKGVDIAPFKEWNPRVNSLGPVATEGVLIEDFMKAMSSLGLSIPQSKELEADGQWHNISVDAMKKNNSSGSYLLNLTGGRNGEAVGQLSNKFTGERLTWKYEGALLTPEQRVKMRAEALQREILADREAAAIRDTAAIHANEIWGACTPADGHGYVVKKGISSEGLRQVQGSVLLKYSEFYGESGKSAIREKNHYLIVPMSNAAGELRAVQAISPDGAIKIFMRGAQKKETMCVLGAESFAALGLIDLAAVGYSEGVATGASFREGSGMPVVVCFDAGNLEKVVAETSSLLAANVTRVLAIDDDQYFVEKALGTLSEELGMSPHAPGDERILVSRGAAGLRSIELGEAVADGQWHQGARGAYCMTLHRDAGSEAVRSVVVDILPTGTDLKKSATFLNRGREAGRVAIGSIEADGKKNPALSEVCVAMAIPEFKSLVGRPTDWNDLAKMEGVAGIKAVLRGVPGCEVVPAPVHEKFGMRESRQVASLSR